jgi:hypothetical protein
LIVAPVFLAEARAMANWELKFSRAPAPIRSAPLDTLFDVRAYILSLPAGTRHHDDWGGAADLVITAVGSASETDIEQATFFRLSGRYCPTSC